MDVSTDRVPFCTFLSIGQSCKHFALKTVALSQVFMLYHFCTLFGRMSVTKHAWKEQYDIVRRLIHQNYRCHQVSSTTLRLVLTLVFLYSTRRRFSFN